MIHSGTDPAAVAEAARLIRNGELIGLPTETVYGLGADASNDAAVALIFAAKGRPSNHPLIVHIAEAQQVLDYASSVPAFAARLIAAFWPGPLTLILPRKPGVATAAAGGQDSIGLRCPSHPVAQALLTACRTGVAGRVRIVLAVSARPRQRMWPMNWAMLCSCLTAGPATSGLNRPSSTAPAASRCCCAPAC